MGITPLEHEEHVEQPGTSVRLAIEGPHVHDAVYAYPSMWVAAHTKCRTLPDTVDRNCVRFFELRGMHSNPFKITAEQVITHGEAGCTFFYPAIQVDQSGSLLAVFDSSGPSRFPSILAGGQLATDPKTSFRGPFVLKAGNTSYFQGDLFDSEDNTTRYGDYSGAALDPNNTNFAWIASEYPMSSSRWNTWISMIGASCDPVQRCCGGLCN